MSRTATALTSAKGRTLWHGRHLNLVRNEPLLVSLARYRENADREPITMHMCDCEAYGRPAVEHPYPQCRIFTMLNLVSSETRSSTHLPVLDIEAPVELYESSEGKHHLYLDVEMSWPRYAVLLTALKWAGVIETGFWIWSLRRRASFVRPPDVKKTEEEKARSENVRWGWIFPNQGGSQQ